MFGMPEGSRAWLNSNRNGSGWKIHYRALTKPPEEWCFRVLILSLDITWPLSVWLAFPFHHCCERQMEKTSGKDWPGKHLQNQQQLKLWLYSKMGFVSDFTLGFLKPSRLGSFGGISVIEIVHLCPRSHDSTLSLLRISPNLESRL